MIYQPIVNIAEIFARKNVTQIILSPGSRCAPLTLAFARHPEIKTRVIPDERAAAFIGLGIAQSLQWPVGLVCTSGSAGLNYYPAVAEAYFQNIPLIILTADRPKEWLGQQDGQTIFQQNVYSNHIKKSYEIPSDFSHKDAVWYTERIISEAINLSLTAPRGPVHINIPLREPLYPSNNEKFIYDKEVRVIDVSENTSILPSVELDHLYNEFITFERRLIVGGQGRWSKQELSTFKAFINQESIPLIGDIISNLHALEGCVQYADIFLGKKEGDVLEELRPELLITFGDSVISKNVKIFLRKYKPKAHWHIQEAGAYSDTYQSLTKVIRTSPALLFEEIRKRGGTQESSVPQERYWNDWQKHEDKADQIGKNFFIGKDFTEFEATQSVIKALPKGTELHLANSMPVRYANFIGVKGKENLTVFANRGTSGIDGCSSTAVGASFVTDKPVVLLTGDMAFFYDRNAFWHNYSTPNLRVVMLNNHGGGIFGLIDGPGDLPEREQYFETTQQLTAENTAKDFGMDYYYCKSREGLEMALREFFNTSGKAKILEIETDKGINRVVFNDFKKLIDKT